ncbi:hypothetical protein BJV74DRAFT_890399 [Russula compacta]|nr:hypothetical protein BJV74DRAFT_890399 [Russula compacta]
MVHAKLPVNLRSLSKHTCKGYPGLPAWLQDNLFACFRPLPHNPKNIWPVDPASVPTSDTRNEEEGLSPPHAAQVVFTEMWPPAAISSSQSTIPPSTLSLKLETSSPSTPMLSSSPDPIPVPPPHQPIIIPQDKAIDLTMSDNKDSHSYHIHSSSANPSIQEI